MSISTARFNYDFSRIRSLVNGFKSEGSDVQGRTQDDGPDWKTVKSQGMPWLYYFKSHTVCPKWTSLNT